MNPFAYATAVCGVLAIGVAHGQTAAPGSGMRETLLRFDPAFLSGRPPVPAPDGPPDCRPMSEADTAFQERVHPPADVTVLAEQVRWWDGPKAIAFIRAA